MISCPKTQNKQTESDKNSPLTKIMIKCKDDNENKVIMSEGQVIGIQKEEEKTIRRKQVTGSQEFTRSLMLHRVAKYL